MPPAVKCRLITTEVLKGPPGASSLRRELSAGLKIRIHARVRSPGEPPGHRFFTEVVNKTAAFAGRASVVVFRSFEVVKAGENDLKGVVILGYERPIPSGEQWSGDDPVIEACQAFDDTFICWRCCSEAIQYAFSGQA